MRTTLNIDDEALSEALRVAPGMTKTGLINEALRAFAKRHRLRGLLRLEGRVRWEGSLDALRKRKGPR